MTIRVGWEDKNGMTNEQKKTFNSVNDAVQWCRTHYKNISSINGHFTWCEPVNHFDLIDMIGGVY